VAAGPTILRWEEPPPTNHGGRRRPPRPRAVIPGGERWQAVADELRAHPGEWAVLRDDRPYSAGGLMTRIREGSFAPFAPLGSFDAATRQTSRGGPVLLYARYIGEVTTVALPPQDTLPQHDLFRVKPELPAWARWDIPKEWTRLVEPPPIPMSELTAAEV
jgi:hypothetical protein